MKIFLALGPRQPLSRQTAWGCLTANLSFPGSGSLAAGRVSGYAQAGLAIAGLILSLVFGLRLIAWALANWSHVVGDQAGPSAFLEMWPMMRWAFLGMAIFAISWLWGLSTGLQIVRAARKADPPNVPPRLGETRG